MGDGSSRRRPSTQSDPDLADGGWINLESSTDLFRGLAGGERSPDLFELLGLELLSTRVSRIAIDDSLGARSLLVNVKAQRIAGDRQ